MDLMEYKAKELFEKYEIPTQNGIVVDSIDEIDAKLTRINFPVVLKAQVQIGGRGKAGGIKFAETSEQAKKAAEQILGMNIKGHIAKKILIVEKADISRELYLSIILDRLTKGPMIIFSAMGGIDIEETAKNNPEKVVKVSIDPLIGVKDYMIRYIINKSGLELNLFDALYDTIKKLYDLFCQYDCLLCEINPLVITPEGKLIAIDGKVTIDDSALNRQPDILAFRDSLTEDELVKEARKFRFLYIPCEPEGNIAVMSNGSGMIMSCIDLISKENMKVGAALDLGGGATSDRIAEAIRIVLSNGNIKVLFISIFGGITRCDEVAGGVKASMEVLGNQDKMVIIRIEGTNKEKGLEILRSTKGRIVPVDSIKEGVKELVARRELL